LEPACEEAADPKQMNSKARYRQMEAADRELVEELLVGRRVLALSVLVDGRPFVGQLPFAVRPDFGALLVHASRLARHSRGLVDGAPFSALIQTRETDRDDPFQLPRLTVNGRVRALAPGSDEYNEAREAYLEKLPSGHITFSLGDFTLFALVVDQARLVAGFGRTSNLTPGALAKLATAADTSAELVADGDSDSLTATGEDL
jgi:putative heme iron utilization protein